MKVWNSAIATTHKHNDGVRKHRTTEKRQARAYCILQVVLATVAEQEAKRAWKDRRVKRQEVSKWVTTVHAKGITSANVATPRDGVHGINTHDGEKQTEV